MSRIFIPVLALLGSLAGCAPPRPALEPAPGVWSPAPEGMSDEAWVQAHAAYDRVASERLSTRTLLAIIDFTLPSNEPRLWVIDTRTDSVIARDYVAHGWASGGTWAAWFSNRWGSNQSSLGVFVTGDAYLGIRGLSLRLDGLEPGINDRARARGLVLHGSTSVNADRASRGIVGRTEGCPAVPMASARRLVNLLQGGSVVFAWYPDPQFLAHSRFLDHSRAGFLAGY